MSCDPLLILKVANEIPKNLFILKYVREMNGLTCADIAEKLGFAKRHTVSFYEHGHEKIPQSVLCIWLKLLKIDFYELFALKRPEWLIQKKEKELSILKHNLTNQKSNTLFDVNNFKTEIFVLAFKRTGMTADELGKKIGKTGDGVRTLLDKINKPKLSTVKPYIPYLKVSLNELYGLKIPTWYINHKKNEIKELEAEIKKLKSQPA